MIEKQFIKQKNKEFEIKQFLVSKLPKVGLGQIKFKKIPLGEKIIIQTSMPGMVVGSRGANLRDLTKELQEEFKLENPHIEIKEIKDVYLNPAIMAERIVSFLEKYGTTRFKSVGHKAIENMLKAGALGAEVIISGKIPGARAKTWRFSGGCLQKCGNLALERMISACKTAFLKPGVVGVKVSLLPPDVQLPDEIKLQEVDKTVKVEEKVEKIKNQASLTKEKEEPNEEQGNQGTN